MPLVSVDDGPRFGVEGTDAVELRGFLLGRRITLALFRQHVDEHGAVVLLHIAKHRDEVVEAVPLQRPHVFESQLFEEGPGSEERLQGLLGLAGDLHHLLADVGKAPEELLHVVAELGDAAARHDLVEVGGQGSHVG